MSHKVEEDYTKRMEQEKQERTKDQLLQALDKIRAPICVCEIVQADTKILFANHTWTTLSGPPWAPQSLHLGSSEAAGLRIASQMHMRSPRAGSSPCRFLLKSPPSQTSAQTQAESCMHVWVGGVVCWECTISLDKVIHML